LNRRIGLPERRFVNITVSYRDNGGIFELVNPESITAPASVPASPPPGEAVNTEFDNTRYNWGDELD